VNLAAVLALVVAQDATPWERILEGVAAASGVGWTAGLAPHLTPIARCLIIVFMLAGRLLPLVWWCRIASSFIPPTAAPAPPAAQPRTERAARRKK
jgi:Trk-type K+ transport system membrane component